jgi:hypothetical protein
MLELPPGVHEKHGRYYWVSRNKWHQLTRVDEGEIALLETYYALTRNDPRTMAGVMIAYLQEGMGELRPNTAKKYRQAIVSRLIPYCGHMLRNSMKPTHVAQFLEARKKAGAAVGGNRERAVLAAVCEFGMRQGWLDSNPCRGVARNTERPSTRYVEHDELVPALDRAPPGLYELLAAAYLTGLRQTDLRAMLKTQVKELGIEITESKTGKKRLIEWTPTLRRIIHAALARSKNDFVFTTTRGLPWSEWGLQSAMRRFDVGFTFRDLRPKAASDAPHNVLGHAAGMLGRYKRRERLKPVK